MKKSYFIIVIILSLLTGFLGGMVSQSLLLFNNSKVESSGSDTVFKKILEIRESKISLEEKVSNLLDSLNSSLVDLYLKTNKVPLSSDLMGTMAVLSADGWLITSKHIFDPQSLNLKGKELNNYKVKAKDNKTYSIKQIVPDPITSLIFLKTDLLGYSSLPLGEEQEVKISEDVFTVRDGSTFFTKISNLNFNSFSELGDYIHSSEIFFRFLKTQDSLTGFKGSPLFNLKGELIGIIEDDYVIPLDYIKDQISRVLKEKKISRSYLGVQYLDLSEIRVRDIKPDLNSGALIISKKILQEVYGPKISSFFSYGILKNSPAQKAGLREGDIIVKVEDEELNDQKSLVDLIQQYRPRQKIKLEIWRNNQSKEIIVELGEKKEE